MTTTTVLLLKSPSEILTSDPYHVELSKRGFRPVFVPILDTVFTNEHKLQDVVHNGPTQRDIAGVTVTSARAAEAWRAAVEAAVKVGGSVADWSTTPFYAVGDSTARVLRAMSSGTAIPLQMAPNPDLVLGAEEAGTSEALAHFIVERYRSHDEHGTVLELTGDKNKDTLRVILANAGIKSENLEVYGTGPSPLFPAALARAVADIPIDAVSWISLFAPSATDFAMPHLRQHFNLPRIGNDALGAGRPALLATIGPTTAEFLRRTLFLDVAAVAAKPDANHLASAIASYKAAGVQ